MKSLSLNQPHVIVMVGVPGSGKSFFAEKFAETFGAPYVSSAKITAITAAPTELLNNLLYYQFDELLKTKQSIVVDGAAETRSERAELSKKARAAGYETLFVWVQTDPATAKMRSTKDLKDKTSPTLSPEEFTKRLKRFTPPETIERPLVISGKHTYATQAKVVLKKLSAPRTKISTQSTPIRSDDSPARRNIMIR